MTPDREKVIKAIEICIKNGCKDGIPNQLCPYSSEVGCDLNRILADALALLKEQEADIKNLNETIMNLLQKITEMKMIYGDCEYVGELVRCKDCRHRDPEDKMCDSGHGIRWQLPRPDDWFCADGERQEGR